MSLQQIVVSKGAVEYTWPTTITETGGKDLSRSTVLMSLGSYDLPGVWQQPDVISRPAPNAVMVQMLIGPTTPIGTHYLWVSITDQPEVVLRVAAAFVVA